jgi:Aerotolerance regulator N-terminal/von Willebrand factor type A domain
MSFLTPFYILGALAIAAPIVLHLIRRTPKGEVPFSSLMFLAATPPRLTRRSRLDNLLLLLLRALALGLLALAFARPFLREAANLNLGDVERRRDLVLIDTSASLRRGDLWPRAKALAEAAIAGARPSDQLAVYAFDSTTTPLLTFAESLTLDPSKRLAIARARLDALSPTWASTNLGQGLVDSVAAIEDVADASEKAGRMPRRIVLVSDLAQGSRLDALGNFEWPSDVELEPKTVTDSTPNAGLQLVAESTETTALEASKELRVRIANDPGSRSEGFKVVWLDARGAEVGQAVDAYVPPGESRVVKVPRVPNVTTLRLKGDRFEFDNTLYFTSQAKDEATVLYVGNDSLEDAEGLSYYLARVFEDTPRRTVKVVSKKPTEPLTLESSRTEPLVVLAGETTGENASKLRKYAEGGGTVLHVLSNPSASATLATLAASEPVELRESPSGRDAMLGEIAFDHPLFASLAGAQFNDFTKIRFWKHRWLDAKALGEPIRVLARFEGGDPAIIEKPVGQGRLVVLASGWNPVDSQLARSSKFVPLMAALLEGRTPPPVELASLTVLDRVPLPHTDQIKIRKPDGSTVTPEEDSGFFTETDQPGVYAIESPLASRSFAVNLDPLESKTTALSVETLEQLGCRLAASEAKVELDREHLRQMQNAELEGRQKLWRGLILAAIGVLIVETLLAGRLKKRAAPTSEALAT